MSLLLTRLATTYQALLLALLVGTAAPAAAQTIYGLEFSYGKNINNLMSFTAANPGTILGRVLITGVNNGQTLVGLDFRPATGELFALGYDNTTQTGQLYVLNLATAVATPVGTAAVPLLLGTEGQPERWGGITSRIGFDFDPVTDLVRVCSSSTQANLLLNPVTGSIAAIATNFSYMAGDPNVGTTPGVGTIAFTNSYAGSTSTTLYAIDEVANQLTMVNAPNSGTLHTITTLVLGGGEYPPASNCDLDFYHDPITGNDIGYFSNSGVDPASGYATLSIFNTTTGVRTSSSWIGPFGGYYEVRDMAVQPATSVVTATRPTALVADLSLAPNPLAESARLSFTLPHPAHVELTITDVLGRNVGTVDAGPLPAGPQTLRWTRQHQAAGVYFFNLRLDGQPVGVVRGTITE